MSQSSIDFTENGPVVPDTATVRDAVETDWQAAFDNRLNPDPATPQGQLITSETAIVQDKNSQLLFLSNMFNPETAEGIYQDALAKIYFLTRQAAVPRSSPVLVRDFPAPSSPASAAKPRRLQKMRTGTSWSVRQAARYLNPEALFWSLPVRFRGLLKSGREP